MLQMISSDSVKGFYFDRDKAIEELFIASKKLSELYNDVIEVRLFGSFAEGEETGTSDFDIIIVTESLEENPVERAKPYYFFMAGELKISLDLIAIGKSEIANYSDIIKKSISIYHR